MNSNDLIVWFENDDNNRFCCRLDVGCLCQSSSTLLLLLFIVIILISGFGGDTDPALLPLLRPHAEAAVVWQPRLATRCCWMVVDHDGILPVAQRAWATVRNMMMMVEWSWNGKIWLMFYKYQCVLIHLCLDFAELVHRTKITNFFPKNTSQPVTGMKIIKHDQSNLTFVGLFVFELEWRCLTENIH